MVTQKCEFKVGAVSHQVKMYVNFKFLESQGEIVTFESIIDNTFSIIGNTLIIFNYWQYMLFIFARLFSLLTSSRLSLA